MNTEHSIKRSEEDGLPTYDFELEIDQKSQMSDQYTWLRKFVGRDLEVTTTGVEQITDNKLRFRAKFKCKHTEATESEEVPLETLSQEELLEKAAKLGIDGVDKRHGVPTIVTKIREHNAND